MNADEIVWEGPPSTTAAGRPPGNKAVFVEALKAHPGKWAVIPLNGAASPVSAANACSYLKEKYGCEAQVRQNVGYARWPE